MCGVIGIVGKYPVNQRIYDALTVLQHRGQDAAGIMTYHEGRLYMRKDNGMVRDVFQPEHMATLVGNMGLGHNRYPTAGCSSSAEAQPFYVNSPFGISLAHNGNLTNAEELKQDLFIEDLRHINTNSDSEILLNVFAHGLQRAGKLKINEQDIFNAAKWVYQRSRGGFAGIAMINGHGLVGFRDPYGIRPLVYGTRQTDLGIEYAIASESVALDALGFETIADVKPGEVIYIDLDGNLHKKVVADAPDYSTCIFEYVYLARPDSVIDDVSVYQSRLRMGEALAEKIKRQKPDHNIDVVIPIPDTSRTAALQLAYQLDVNYREGFIKNRYIGRTFIMPGQKARKKSVRQKLNAMAVEFSGKNVLLVDDSIVRGTTSKEIIQMARDAGAKKVFFASAAPAVKYPNVYGIDMPSARELIASNKTDEQVADAIGADWLIYQDLEDLMSSVSSANKNLTRFDTSCFTGEYITGDVTAQYLDALDIDRNDKAKEQRDKKLTDHRDLILGQ